MAVTLDPADRDAIVLALALTSLQRPGWSAYLRDVAITVCGDPGGGRIFDDFCKYNDDQGSTSLPPKLEALCRRLMAL